MSHDVPETELMAVVADDQLVLLGDPWAVRAVTARLGDAVLTMRPTRLERRRLGHSACVTASLRALGAASGEVIRFSPDHLELLRRHDVIPGEEGFFRLAVRGEDAENSGTLEWRRVSRTPEQARSMQNIAADLELRGAITDVDRAVARVEGKAKQVLALAEAQSAGDVIARHRAVRRAVEEMDRTGRLSSADWQAVATFGPDFEAVVERLRRFVSNALREIDASNGTADAPRTLQSDLDDGRLRDALHLLLVAKDALYLWQLLRLERVHETEGHLYPEAQQRALGRLRDDTVADGEVLTKLSIALAECAAQRPLEPNPRLAVRRLRHSAASLQREVEAFASARRPLIDGWIDPAVPLLLGGAAREFGARTKSLATDGAALGQDALMAGITGGIAGIVSVAGATRAAFAERRDAAARRDAHH